MPQNLRRLFVVSTWMFVIAAGAGVMFRWAMVGSLPLELGIGDIRHAHSHLMLMGWATPALMALMASRWPKEGGRRVDGGVAIVGWTSLALALASFFPFLLYGYDSVPIGGAQLPLAAILSGLAMLAWYGFAAIYFGANRNVERTPALRLWDLAVSALVVSSIGAWAVAGLMMAGVDNPLWEHATVHFFVELFGLGWLVVGGLGVIRSNLDLRDSLNERVGRILVGVGAGFVFLVGLPRGYAPELWPLFGSAAAGLVAAGLALILQRMWSSAGLWSRRALIWIALSIAMLAAMAIPPVADWGLTAGLRIFFLHVAFAGFVTMALVVGARARWGREAVGSAWLWLGAVLVLLVTMIPLTGLWPRELAGGWTPYCALVGALAATVATLVACGVGYVRGRRNT